MNPLLQDDGQSVGVPGEFGAQFSGPPNLPEELKDTVDLELAAWSTVFSSRSVTSCLCDSCVGHFTPPLGIHFPARREQLGTDAL